MGHHQASVSVGQFYCPWPSLVPRHPACCPSLRSQLQLTGVRGRPRPALHSSVHPPLSSGQGSQRLPAPVLPVLGPGLCDLQAPGSCPCGHALPVGMPFRGAPWPEYSTCDTIDHTLLPSGGELMCLCLPQNKLVLGASPEDPSASQRAVW